MSFLNFYVSYFQGTTLTVFKEEPTRLKHRLLQKRNYLIMHEQNLYKKLMVNGENENKT